MEKETKIECGEKGGQSGHQLVRHFEFRALTYLADVFHARGVPAAGKCIRSFKSFVILGGVLCK
jgi:hypothetical protein